MNALRESQILTKFGKVYIHIRWSLMIIEMEEEKL